MKRVKPIHCIYAICLCHLIFCTFSFSLTLSLSEKKTIINHYEILQQNLTQNIIQIPGRHRINHVSVVILCRSPPWFHTTTTTTNQDNRLYLFLPHRAVSRRSVCDTMWSGATRCVFTLCFYVVAWALGRGGTVVSKARYRLSIFLCLPTIILRLRYIAAPI